MEQAGKMTISEARANMSELVSVVRLQRRCFLLVRRDKPQAALVPPEFIGEIEKAGGADAALEVLRKHNKG